MFRRIFNKMTPKTACQTCVQLRPIKIKHPFELISCIEMMKKLIETSSFEKALSNFELEQPKEPDGYWKQDFMHYSIRCKECGQIYSCDCDTHHGNGRFCKSKQP